MTDTEYLAAVDIGTTNIKMGLFSASDLELKITRTQKITLTVNGEEAVQYPEEWWDVICKGIRGLVAELDIPKESVRSISFCSQMGSFIPIDSSGGLLFDSLNCIDGRGYDQYMGQMGRGFKVAGVNLRLALKCVSENQAIPASHKDTVWKYRWFKENRPELYARMYKALDVNSYLLFKCTGKAAISYDSAFAYLLLNTKTGRWSDKLCRLFDIDIGHLPDTYYSTEMVGHLTKESAESLGLTEATEVYAGGGDITMINLGSSAIGVGERHIYGGSSAWVGTMMDRQTSDLFTMMTGFPSAFRERYCYFGQLEVAGTSLEWAMVDVLKERVELIDSKKGFSRPGSNGVIFTPWINGVRAPIQAPHASGSVRNVNLSTSRYDICRAIVEGIAYHMKWLCHASDKRADPVKEVYFVGGMAISDLICQIMADVTGYRVLVPYNPQQAGLYGVAMCCEASKAHVTELADLKKYIRIERTFEPNPDNRAVYDECYNEFLKMI